ncbi:hypothetical protein QWY14_10300 [Planococcus sp. N028]|uniref:Uncharacterized protein n=1 Tax=Planococcus shixiaomingii TaxID=3058393 RepID=A0ABT8N2S7_9BACL|nr:hypothetical protein [Planococcus sp. N028]MDN7242192.1 hypothetical protein [Planococcus sp. N028]
MYYSTLILSFVILVWMFGYLWYLYNRKKKQGDSYKAEKETLVTNVVLILLSGALFVYYLLDLPNVLGNKTERYEGDCEVWVLESTKGGETTASFGNHTIVFPENYQGAKEGSYYCEVAYYPRTETGASLTLYKSKGGKVVNQK